MICMPGRDLGIFDLIQSVKQHHWQLVTLGADRSLGLMSSSSWHIMAEFYIHVITSYQKYILLCWFYLQVYCSSSAFFMEKPSIQSSAVESKEFLAGIKVIWKENNVLLICSRSLPEYLFSRYVTIHAFSLGMLENLYE